MRQVTLIADYFIIASGRNLVQVGALADHVGEAMERAGARLLNPRGWERAHWVLMDYGAVVIHIFTAEERRYYNLDRFWGDAEVVKSTAASVDSG